MADLTRFEDESLLHALGEALVPSAVPPEADLARLRETVRRQRAGGAPAGVLVLRRRRDLARRRAVIVAGAAAAVVALVATLTLAPSPSPSASLAKVEQADSTLQQALATHASRTATVHDVQALSTAIGALPPADRAHVPPGASSLVTRACQHLGPPPAGSTGPPLPSACSAEGLQSGTGGPTAS